MNVELAEEMYKLRGEIVEHLNKLRKLDKACPENSEFKFEIQTLLKEGYNLLSEVDEEIEKINKLIIIKFIKGELAE